jgi:hypothetical protein
MVISIWLISRLKITEASPFLIDAARAKSKARVDFAYPRSRCHYHQLPRVQAVGQVVEVGEAGGHPR